MKSEISSLTRQSVYVCKNCKRELPLEAFYVNKATQCPDKYCKECRKSLSRSQYNNVKLSAKHVPNRDYPVITEIEDRELRIRLIVHALEVVQRSKERRKMKLQEALILEEALLLQDGAD